MLKQYRLTLIIYNRPAWIPGYKYTTGEYSNFELGWLYFAFRFTGIQMSEDKEHIFYSI